MTLKGYTAPLSPDGRASIVPPPPWHYSGDFLIVEYRTDPAAVAALLPPELEPHADARAGMMAAIFADWQSCSEDGHELVDPIQSQYREFFLVVGATFQGQPVSRCVYIWVDKDFAMYRGWIQGFPKKLGSIHMTRPSRSAGRRRGRAGRAVRRHLRGERPAGRARSSSRCARVSETGPTVNDPPMYNTRHFPAYDGTRPDVFELVRAGGCDRDATEIWEGDAELRLYDDTLEDLQRDRAASRCCRAIASRSATPWTAARSSPSTTRRC